MNKNILAISLICGSIVAMTSSCGSRTKIAKIEKEAAAPKLELTDDKDLPPDLTVSVAKRDTIVIQDFEGRKVQIMKAVRDQESGEMVATDVLDAAVVQARFRNLAERQGKVDIAFQIIVPERMQDSKWQLRFYPDMFVMGDSLRLEPVIITGKDYRKAQLRGYQQYDKFLRKIISDTTRFVDLDMLEIFLQRNIPQIFAFKTDSTFVSDEEFLSYYGVSEKEAIDHYTNKAAKKMNEKRKSRMNKMYSKYVKAPIITEGIRLDTVIMDANGDFIYNYIQTVNTRPKMKKVDIILSGEIFEQEKKLYDIPKCPPLTFYISTLSTFAIDLDKYMTKIIERRASANTESRIDFELGKSDIVPSLGNNQEEIDVIKENLAMLLDNNIFDLDSITVAATASPEGSYSLNRNLAQRRSVSVSDYFSKYIKHYTDSLSRYGGFSVSVVGDDVKTENKHLGKVDFSPRCIPENWDDLGRFISDDDSLSREQKDEYFELLNLNDPDSREHKMQQKAWYKYVKDKYYPSLRTVKFRFFLHRKGMVKDTLHTTMLDTTYIKGVKCLKNMDYEDALNYLRPDNDFNTAIAYLALNRNKNAMMILSPMDRTAEVNYLLAILYARDGQDQQAVECYLKACKQKDIYIHRGNLDPEISHLIKAYGLNKLIDDMLSVELGY